MIIKKIILENIRSYLNQEIEFPVGSVMLSGDIGSGKSTVLLGVDFALFGLRRGEMSGSSLLRNGTKKGSVELHFDIDGKKVVIKRSLKRTKDSVVHDAGYTIINGKKEVGTHVELKQKILSLLNYPSDLLTKSKSLVYRYTVYTPQDEMKHILLSDKDSRLDTLRKVFGIDKYKRIRENGDIFLRKFREKRREFAGAISDLEDKKQERDKKRDKVREIKDKVRELTPQIKDIEQSISKNKLNIDKLEEKRKEFNLLTKESDINSVKLQNKKEQDKKIREEMGGLDSEIKELNKDLEKYKRDASKVELEKEIANKENQINLMDETVLSINKKVREFEVKRDNSLEIKNQVSSLDECPTCYQVVSGDYKKRVIDTEKEKIKKFEDSINLNLEQVKEAKKVLGGNKDKLEELRKIEREYELVKLKLDNLKVKTNKVGELLQLQEKNKKEISEINVINNKLSEKISKLSHVEEDYGNIKKELDNLIFKQRDFEVERATFDQEVKSVSEMVDMLTEDIEKKSKIKKNLVYYGTLQEWMDKYFVNLMGVMEKKIMFKLHSDFNNLFEKWFNILVENEDMKIRLDEEFTPKIEQNGYDIDYEYLSGGEKTAAALAYRLALNQVINNVMSVIKTKDLLILDEPTDGFSEDQLDRIKIVLEELDAKQIIVVSHENKVESFVDSVLKFTKEGHVSRVEY